jgi:hypothetical protein
MTRLYNTKCTHVGTVPNCHCFSMKENEAVIAHGQLCV